MNPAAPSPAVAPSSLLDRLSAAAPPLALVDPQGALQWCSAHFGALFAAAGPGTAWLGDSAWQQLLANGRLDLQAGAAPWRLHAMPDRGGWLLSAEPQPAAAPAGASAATDAAAVVELGQRAARLSAELQVVLEVSGIGLWRVELPDGRLVPDKRGSEIIGLPYRPEGLPLDEARARIHPADLAQAEASAQRTLRTGEPTDMQLRYPAPGGRWRHVLLRRALQRGPDGRPLAFVGVMIDETERVEQERRSREIARRLQTAAESARVGLWSVQRNAELPDWNRQMFELFGLDPAAGPIAFRHWLARCVHPDDRRLVHDEVVGWWQRGSDTHEYEFRVVRPSDGQTRWLLVRGRMDPADDDGVARAEGIAQDITEQMLTLRRLRETVERMSLTTHALGLGTWTGDADCDTVQWDEQMFRLRGIASPARTMSRAELGALLHPDDREAVMARQVGRIVHGEAWRDSYRIVWPDGQVRWITSHSVPVRDEQGRIEGRIGVNWDSTEAHQAAQALRERELAVAESQAKSQAMSRISHELRTPLNAILGFTQLLRSAQAEADPERRLRWLAHVEDAGRHLLALIDDVLELSRAQVGEIRLARETVDCAAIVDGALALVASLAQQHGVTLRPGALDGAMLADPVRLRQVVINLLSNAIKYNRPGGEVRIWTEAAPGAPAQWTLQVADTGLGIAPEQLRHAFEPFNRLGAEATGVEGSGIGLAIVKAMVEQMGGQVQACSELGRGSCFSVTLPAAPAAAAAPTADAPDASAAPAQRPPAARVLYIEDNPVNALLVREILTQRPGITLQVAEDGGSGLRAAVASAPDLVLMDMQLPDMDGHAVLRALRADPRAAGLCCVALSANATQADLDAALAAGFADYWVKPIDLPRFLAGVDAMLGGPR